MRMGSICSTLWLTVYPKDCRCQLAEPRLSSEICLLIAPMECGRPRNHSLRDAESGYGARENVARWKWVSSPRLRFSENNLCGPSPPPKFSSPSPNPLAKAVSAAVDVSGKEATTGLHLGLPTSLPQASTGGPTPSPMAGLQHSVSLDAGFLLLPLSFSPLDLLPFFQPGDRIHTAKISLNQESEDF